MLGIKPNMGSLDRIIRSIVGITLLTLGPFTEVFDVTIIAEIAMGVVGVFALLSATTAYCVIYDFANIDTLGKKSERN